MSLESEALAEVLKCRLNERQAFAYRKMLGGMDWNYTVQGGPGSGKSMLLTHVAAELDRRHPGQTLIVSIQRGPANVYAKLGLNATSVAGFVAMPELLATTTPSAAFKRRYPIRHSNPLYLLWDEYAFATADNIALVLACVAHMTTGPVQLIAFGDVGQLEPPSDGLPAICHPIFRNRRKMRACVLTDMRPRFLDPELLYVVQQLRDYSKPISVRAEQILVNRSYAATMWRRRQPVTTLCVTNKAVFRLNRRQWQRAEKAERAVVHTVAKVRTVGSRPDPAHIVYNKQIMFVRAYVPPKGAEDSRYIANGEMALLVSGPRGELQASSELTFVVTFEDKESVAVTCTTSTTGKSKGYCSLPFLASAGLTMAKIQGLTIPTLTVDLAGCNRVSTMVAISRARTFDNLDGAGGVSIINYEPGTADRMSGISPEVLTATIAFAQLEKQPIIN